MRITPSSAPCSGPMAFCPPWPRVMVREGDVGVEPAGEVGEQAGPFVVRVRGDEKDARGDAGFVDGFDCFGEGLGGGGDGDRCG